MVITDQNINQLLKFVNKNYLNGNLDFGLYMYCKANY